VKIIMFTAYDKAKPDTEDTRGINLTPVKRDFPVTATVAIEGKYDRRDLLYRGWTDTGIVYCVKGTILNNPLYLRYIRVTYIDAFIRKNSISLSPQGLNCKNCNRKPQVVWHKELTDNKLSVVQYLQPRVNSVREFQLKGSSQKGSKLT
jgi:hypothetical protein